MALSTPTQELRLPSGRLNGSTRPASANPQVELEGELLVCTHGTRVRVRPPTTSGRVGAYFSRRRSCGASVPLRDTSAVASLRGPFRLFRGGPGRNG